MTHPLLEGVASTTAHRDRDEVDRSIAKLLMQFLQPYSVTLLRLIGEGKDKRVEHRVRLSPASAEEGPVGKAVEELPLLADFPHLQECVIGKAAVPWREGDGEFTTAFPISGEHEIVGLLVVETDAPVSSRESDLVQGVLEIVKNHLALLDYGELDALTGLLNRKTFDGYFERMRRRLSDQGKHGSAARIPMKDVWGTEPSLLALIDIDHFKSVNDRYGHLFGDEVLLLVSQLMKRAFRGADQLFRFGGEEFVVVLEHASEAGAQLAFERLRTTVEDYPFPQVGQVTISLGYTMIQLQDVPALCIGRADAALYYAKEHGRNNVRNCEMLIDTGEISGQARSGEVELF